MPASDALRTVLAAATAADFSGVVRVDRGEQTLLEEAAGLADRRFRVPCSPATRFGIASGTKSLTAVTVLSLVADGTLALGTRVRDLLGPDLPLVDDAVTVEHLLAHRSGIGDYFDEELLTDDTDYVMPVPVHTLATTEDYLPVLDGHPQVTAPGERFAYNNGGYVVLALVAGRASGSPFEELVLERVCRPAAMASTAFLRGDELPDDAATGYPWPDRDRTNVLHLPVLGSGDGGLFTTAADVVALWRALLDGRLLPPALVEEAWRARSTEESGRAYGLGFWLEPADGLVEMHGGDAGVSFRTVHDRRRDLTWTVLSNTTDGAWSLSRAVAGALAP
ncbi:serine hydrolase domain-containing protein [Phycicoccus avicenniae]|uniref:serine hydrolase domain-containing protein n=1 Tax=Phycicoccus avicenniae TaxID=2828860 RepID=UPI003D29E44B